MTSELLRYGLLRTTSETLPWCAGPAVSRSPLEREPSGFAGSQVPLDRVKRYLSNSYINSLKIMSQYVNFMILTGIPVSGMRINLEFPYSNDF